MTIIDQLLRDHDRSTKRRLLWVALFAVVWTFLATVAFGDFGRLFMPVGLIGAGLIAAAIVMGGRRHRARAETLLRNPQRAVRAYVATVESREGIRLDKLVHVETVDGDIVALWSSNPRVTLDALAELHPGIVLGAPAVP